MSAADDEGDERGLSDGPTADVASFAALSDAADRLDELGDTADLMGDPDGAHRWRERAAAIRMAAMRHLDDRPTA